MLGVCVLFLLVYIVFVCAWACLCVFSRFWGMLFCLFSGREVRDSAGVVFSRAGLKLKERYILCGLGLQASGFYVSGHEAPGFTKSRFRPIPKRHKLFKLGFPSCMPVAAQVVSSRVTTP